MKSSPSTARPRRAAVGGRDQRVAGGRDQCADLPLARRVDLLGQARTRAARRSPRAALAPGSSSARARSPGRVPGSPEELRCPAAARGEHGAALAVEVAGEDVDHVDQPAGERAELLRAGADPPVDGGALGRRQLARHAADLVRGDAARSATASGAKSCADALDLLEPVQVLVDAPRDRPAPPRTGCARCHSSRCASRARPDEVVLVGGLGGPGAPRVHDHDLSAALADRAKAAAHVGRGEQAPVGHERVGAQDEQVVACGRRRVSGSRAARRTSGRPTGAWASGRPCWRCRRSSTRARAATPGRRAARTGCGRWGCRCRRPPSRGRARPGWGRAARPPGAGPPPSDASANCRRACLTSGVRSRSGSACRCSRPVALGHRKPWLNTSSRRPGRRRPRCPTSVTSRPQVASQKGQVRKCVLSLAGTSP